MRGERTSANSEALKIKMIIEKTLEYNSEFNPAELCSILDGELFQNDETNIKSVRLYLKRGKSIFGRMEINFFLSREKEVSIDILPPKNRMLSSKCMLGGKSPDVISHFSMKNVETVKYTKYNKNLSIVLFDHASSELSIIKEKESFLGYNIAYYNYKTA